MKISKKVMKSLAIVLGMFAIVLTGCSANSAKSGMGTLSAEGMAESGVLRLKINPDLSIHYNENGEVTEVTGENEDGVKLLEDYSDYIGKESGQVLEELIALLSEAGYFVDDLDGESRRIVLELEKGSALPDDKFLEKMTKEIEKALADLDLRPNIANDSEAISIEEAKEIAFSHAGVKIEGARIEDIDFDIENNLKIYEIDFEANGYEYEYKINALTGEIVKSKNEKDDDDDDDDDDKEEGQEQDKEYISKKSAKQIALDHAGVSAKNAKFDDVELDTDDGVPSYEIEFEVGEDEYEYDIHAVTGKILDFEQDIEDSKPSKKPETKPEAKPETKPEVKPEEKPEVKPEVKPEAKPKQISKNEAINIALKHAGLSSSEVKIEDAELDDDDGKYVWEIEFESGDWEFEYEIDASTSKILSFDKEEDD